MSQKKVVVIGAGFSGLSTACYLVQKGYKVTILEKNSMPGGRARVIKEDGFQFDMGPTWYWMPDVFENFFRDFNYQVDDFYKLSRLDPGYRVYYGKGDFIDIAADPEEIIKTFENEEQGSGVKLRRFLNQAKFNYRVAMNKIVHLPGKSPFELISFATIMRLPQFFNSIQSKVRSKFKNPKLAQILEFPVLFLGAKPKDTPAFYCFMNYADMVMGTWYPEGGMFAVVKAFEKLAVSSGVEIKYNQVVNEITINQNKVTGVRSNDQFVEADAVVSSADYQFTESILPSNCRNYSAKYWKSRVFAPSALLFYVGFNKRIKNVEHHTLFFDTSFDSHAKAIYDNKQWPEDPLFYASFPSKSDSNAAPEGMENAIFLIPIATNIEDTKEIRNRYFDILMDRLESVTQQSVRNNVVYKKSYCVNDFVNDYNAYGGNAYGLSNILKQTAFLKPKLQNKKLPNMFYAGQLTVPGPGVPPTIISGKIVANLAIDYLESVV